MKKENIIYTIIYGVIMFLAFLVATSFFTFNEEYFDWQYCIIVVCLIVVSKVLESIIVNAIVDCDKKVIELRCNAQQALEEIDKNNKWNEYKQLLHEDSFYRNFYRCHNLYFNIDPTYINKRENAQLNKHDFKIAYTNNNLSRQVKKEKMPFKNKKEIIEIEKENKDNSCFYKIYLDFKKGCILGNSPTASLKLLISIIFNLFALGVSIYSVFKFNVNGFESSKITILFIFLLADIYFIFSNTRILIETEIDKSRTYIHVKNILVLNENPKITKSLGYSLYHKIK